jgi:hypothetical protein
MTLSGSVVAMKVTLCLSLALMLFSVATLSQELTDGGLPEPSEPQPAPRFGFKPVEEQPPAIHSFTPREPDLEPPPEPHPAVHPGAGIPVPGRFGAPPVRPVTEPGLELRRRGDLTVQGRLPGVRRYGDLTKKPVE